MSKTKARVFVPLTKVDEEQRLVYGVMTQEVLDKSGEMMDYDKSKPHFEKWSNDIHTATGGLSKGNLRVMHGLNVAGKVTEMEFDDENKTIEICTKVVDDGEWNKVLEGCYTGFSVGGSYGKKWNEVVDGQQVKKYEAKPNEVSLVDNPCVPSATFSLVKADGHEEHVMFKAAEGEQRQLEEENVTEEPKQAELEKTVPVEVVEEITNELVATRATEMAKAADNGTTWMDHVEAAREDLIKAFKEKKKDGKAADGKEDKPAAKGSEEEKPKAKDDDADEAAEKVTPAGVMQKWTTTDGQLFDKKADAVTHEESLAKAAVPAVEPTEAELLAARLSKALDPETPADEQEELPLLEDFDRLSKTVQALVTPFDEEGKPKLEKGMYTVNRFSNVLSDMAAVASQIKREGKKEGNDAADGAVSAELLTAVKTLGASFISYASDQVTELLAGLDDDVMVCYHDYYYNAAQIDPTDGLAKDVCSVINDFREKAGDRREELAKAFGITDTGESLSDELSPPMQKRFDELTESNQQLAKVATAAVEKVEELAKRVQELADKPEPRAPLGGSVPMKGDESFLGKAASSDEEKMAILKSMLEVHGADGMATMLIKASQATGGQQLTLKS